MKPYLQVNQRAYDQLAQEYGQKRASYVKNEPLLTGPFIRHVKARFDDVRVLELGPGSGLALSHFEAAGIRTSAIDISAKMIEVARCASPATEYIHGEFLEHGFGDAVFEGVFADAFIHLFPADDAIRVLEKIHGLLCPAGVAYLGTTLHDAPWEGFKQKSDYAEPLPRFRKHWTETELMGAVDRAGFDLAERFYTSEPGLGKDWINLVLTKRKPAQ